MQFFIYIFSLIIVVFCLPSASNCQQEYNPNLGHFYMGRQQITIEDNSPIINNKTGNPVSGGGNGAILNRPAPLPKAGWQPYAPIENPGTNPNLPKVPAPVRQAHTSHPHTGPGGKSGHPGNLAGKNRGNQPSSGAVKSYSPYSQYPAPAPNTQAAEELGASTHVKGSLLHWARHKNQ